ncbi:MAG: transposase [Desulfobacterales bacterium]|jgi:REP element-mobilizing transposase RayT|nr:transposase [Desulfobacterales bacterium]
MPRLARIDAPGALHHIIIRGIERRAIFKDRIDRTNFIKRLGMVLSETSTPCYAWVLMHNHVHLLLKTGLTPVATLMRRLLTGYAQQFNRRHRRHGQLFQNRYKSFLCQEDAYLLELVRYIHLNPLRAGVVKDLKTLNNYAWCGHRVLMGKVSCNWQDRDYVLRLFGKREGPARRAYAAFIAKGKNQGRRHDLVGGGLIRSVGGWAALKDYQRDGIRIKGDERILGSSDFVEEVLKKANEKLEKRTLLQAKGPDLDQLIKQVAKYYHIDLEELKTTSKARTVSLARSALCYLAVRQLLFSCAEVARTLNISASAVSKAVAKGQALTNRTKIQKEILRI